MATSGAFSTSNQYVKYKITITQNSQSVANNTSNVTVNVFFYRTNTGYTTYGSGTLYVKINGEKYEQAVIPDNKITNSGITLFSKTLNIGHNADGTKTLTCSAWISMNTPLSSDEQSYSQVLTTIPRASTPTLSASSVNFGGAITINTNRASSSFTHTLTYKVESGGATGTIATGVGASKSWTVPTSLISGFTNAKSSKITVTCVTYNGSTNIGTKTVSFTANIPVSVPTLSATSTNINGNTVTITTNRVNSSLTHAITYKFGSLTGQTSGIGNSSTAGDSTTFNPPASLYSQLPNSTSGTCVISVTTKNGTTEIGTKTLNLTLNVDSTIKPIISNVSVSEYKQDIATKFGAYIQKKSQLKINFDWVAGTGSSLSTKSVEVNGKKYSTNNITTGVLNTSGNNSLVIEAQDTRGRSANKHTSYFQVLEYEKPSINNFEVRRCDAEGNPDDSGGYVLFSIDASIYSLGNKNDKQFKLSYKKTTEEEWTNYIIESSNYSLLIEESILTSGKDLIPIDIESSYNFKLTVSDYFEEIPRVLTVSTGATILDIYNDGSGMATGKVAEHPDTFDIGNKYTFLSTNSYMGGEKRTNEEKNLFFQSTEEGTYKHNCKLYGGNSESDTSIGLWDNDKSQTILRYLSHKDELQFGKELKVTHNGGEVVSVKSKASSNRSGHVLYSDGLLIQWGVVVITPVANTPTSVTLNFAKPYSHTPSVKLSVATTVIGTTVTGVAHNGASPTSVDISVTRINTTSTSVEWLAIGFAEE